ncbi:hypothetical protein BLA29_000469 [Euroglyphus maynei]|uniref:RecA family profile 1 domain-containing protein n=1 Tax=Euroglyphus maynei TaxID=6958 RepID=A0A1Y3BSB9_EURMA|nr:hypothetical protein BLA29_000469 [Euroglyphus maynei]
MDMIRLSNVTRFLSDYPNLSASLKLKLKRHGFLRANQLRFYPDIRVLESKQFGFLPQEVNEIETNILNVNRKCTSLITTATLDIHTEYIRSGSIGFDRAFGGKGLPTGRLTQVFGEAGAGKSQIWSLCFRVRLDTKQGGLNGEALYLDTENSFRPERIKEIAMNHYCGDIQDDHHQLEYRLNKMLMGIHFCSVNTHADDLLTMIVGGKLESFLDDHSNVRLLLLDSIAYHFRYDYQHTNSHRIVQLMTIANKLKQLAHQRNMAIVIINQVSFDNNNQALGEPLKTTCSTTLNIKRLDAKSERQCTVIKSPSVARNFHFKYIINVTNMQHFLANLAFRINSVVTSSQHRCCHHLFRNTLIQQQQRLLDKFDREVRDTMERIKTNQRVKIKRKKASLSATTKALMMDSENRINPTVSEWNYPAGSPEQLVIRRQGLQQSFITSRMRILNTNFLRATAEIFATDAHLSKLIIEFRFRITDVRVSSNYQYLQVYWTNENADDRQEIGTILNSNKGRLHELLIGMQFARNVPWIQFVFDLQASNDQEIEQRLEKCRAQSGNIEKINPEQYCHSIVDRISEGERPSSHVDDISYRSHANEYDEMRMPADIFRKYVPDLDYEALMNKVMQNMPRTRAQHEEDLLQMKALENHSLGESPFASQQRTASAAQPIDYDTENRIKAIRKFVQLNKKRKDKMERRLKRSILSEEIERFDDYGDLKERLEQRYEELFPDQMKCFNKYD